MAILRQLWRRFRGAATGPPAQQTGPRRQALAEPAAPLAVDVGAELTKGMSRLISRHDKQVAALLRQRETPADFATVNVAPLAEWLHSGQAVALARHEPQRLFAWLSHLVRLGSPAIAYLPLSPAAETHLEDVALPLLAARLAYLTGVDVPFGLDGRSARRQLPDLLHAAGDTPLLVVLERLDQAEFDLAGLLPTDLPESARLLLTVSGDAAKWLNRLDLTAGTTALVGWPSQTGTAAAGEVGALAALEDGSSREAEPPDQTFLQPPLSRLQAPISTYRSPTSAGRLAAVVPRVVRQARLVDQSRRLPPPLLGLAVSEGLLSPDRALALARSQPGPVARADALLVLCRAALPVPSPANWQDLPEEARDAALTILNVAERARRLAELPQPDAGADAIVAAKALPDLAARAELLAAIGAWPEALAAAAAVGAQSSRAALLAGMAADLPPAFLAGAVRMVQALDENGRYAADALCALIPRLPASETAALQQWIWDMSDHFAQVRTGICLMNGVPEAEKAVWLERLRAAAEAISYPPTRIELWTQLVPLLPQAEREPLLGELWQLAESIDRPEFRAEALGRIAVLMRAPLRDEKLAAAAVVLNQIPDSFTRDSLWGAWASALCQQPSPEAIAAGLAAFRHVTGEYLCVALLEKVADRLAELPSALVVPAIARLLPTSTNRAVFWRDNLSQFPAAFVPAIRADMESMSDRTARRIGLTALAPLLDAGRAELVRHLLAEATNGENRSALPVLLAAVARRLPQRRRELLRQAAKALAAWDEVNQAYLLADMISRLGAAAPGSLREQALAAVTHLGAPDALLIWPTLLAGVDEDQRRELAPLALDAALAAPPSVTRVHRILDLLPHLDATGVTAVWAQFESLGPPMQWPALLRAFAPHLSPALLDEALDRLIGLPGQQMSMQAASLVEIVPVLSADQLELAGMAADEILFSAPRIQAQAAVAARLAEPARSQRLAELLVEARDIPVDVARAAALGDLAAYLQDGGRTVVLREVLAILSGLENDMTQAHHLLRIAPLATETVAAEMVHAIGQIGREEDRSRLLTAVAPRLPANGVGALLPLVVELGDKYAFQPALTALIPHLPADLLPDCLHALRARARELIPPTCLAALAGRWAELVGLPGIDAEVELVLTLEAFARGGFAALLPALDALLEPLAEVGGEPLLLDLVVFQGSDTR